MKKMLVLDIDGTLTNSKKEIAPRTLKNLINIQKQGHIVVLASGRPTPGMNKIAKQLELEKYGGYILSYNGARVINAKTGEIVYQKTLDNDMLNKLYDFAIRSDIGLVTYEKNGVITGTRVDEWMEFEARINGLSINKISNFVEYVDFPVNKCLLTAATDVAPKFEEELVKLYSNRASIYRSEPFFIEVMPKGIDKAASLDRLVNALGMKVEDVIACGDGFNDMSMIKYAGIGVAMANAQKVVKEVADYITLSNDEEGLIPVIEKYIQVPCI